MKKRLVNKGKTAERDKLTPAAWNQLERFQALSMRMAGFLHQVKTPLHVLQSQAELLLESPRLSLDEKKSMEMILHNAERVATQTRTLLDLAKGVRQSLETAPLNPLLEEICHSVLSDCRKKNIALETKLESISPVLMDAVTLQGALHNLVANAIEALPIGGALRVVSEEVPAKSRIRVEIHDDGPGLSAKSMQQIQKPFQTSKSEGTGLGLFIAKHIFSQHKASFKFESEEGKGTTVTVEFPVAKAA